LWKSLWKRKLKIVLIENRKQWLSKKRAKHEKQKRR
jgi:hypothetical protein